MTTYGLTLDGFVPRTFDVIKSDVVSQLRGRLGSTIAFDDESVEGQVVTLVCSELALLWSTGQDVYSSQDPDKAGGQALEAESLLVNVFRDEATASAVDLTFTGDPASNVDHGAAATASSGTTPPIFETQSDVATAAAPARATSTTYAIGAIVTNAANVYYCATPGISGVGAGPSTKDAAIVDGTVTWRWLGAGTAYVTTVAICTVTGPVAGPAGSLSKLQTSIPGINNVTNILDASPGANVMTDPELRKKRNREIAKPGTGTVDAVLAELEDIDGVTSVSVFNNPSNGADADGVPAHSFEILIRGGDDQVIRDAILANQPLGIQSFGSTTGTAIDSKGVAHVINFSRPTEKLVYLKVSITKDPKQYPVDGDDQAKQAILDDGFFQNEGTDVVASRISAQAWKVNGLIDVTEVLMSLDPVTVPVSSTTIPISTREVAIYDTSRMTIVSIDGVP